MNELPCIYPVFNFGPESGFDLGVEFPIGLGIDIVFDFSVDFLCWHWLRK